MPGTSVRPAWAILPRKNRPSFHSPSRQSSLACPAPTTAGTSRARARMAVWLVLLPKSVTRPFTLPPESRMAASAVGRS